MEWILILVIYASTLSRSDSVAITTIAFNTSAECETAGKLARELETSFKSTKYICAQRKEGTPR
jgi:hypothetical protein